MEHLTRAIEHLSRQIEGLVKKCLPGHEHHKIKIMRLLVIVRPAEKIKEKDIIMEAIELGKINLGMRVPVDFVPDEALDVKSDGNYAAVEITSGDSTAHIGALVDGPGSYDSEPKRFRVYVYGDGALGVKSATVSADGHVGEGDVEITQVINWEVVSPDATVFTSTVGAPEKIPIPTVP